MNRGAPVECRVFSFINNFFALWYVDNYHYLCMKSENL